MTHSIGNDITVIEGALVDVIEGKVKVATAATTISGTITGMLGFYIFHDVLPDWLTAIVDAVVTGAVVFFAAYRAKHTPRTVTSPTSNSAIK